MKHFSALALWLCLTCGASLAQNPTCPTRPLGDNTNACASTAFVIANAGGGGGGGNVSNSGTPLIDQIAIWTNSTTIKGVTLLPIANGGTGTATPSLVGGTDISIIGTWPNQTISTISGGTCVCTGVTNGVDAAPGIVGEYVEVVEPLDINSTVTFSHGFPTITAINALTAGARVNFTTTGALPTSFTVGTNYYVSSIGLSPFQFEVSATPTGTPIDASSAGSGTQTVHTQISMATNTVADIAAITVSAGDWDCEAVIALDQSGAPAETYNVGWLSITPTTLPADPGIHGALSSLFFGTSISSLQSNFAIKRYHLNVSAQTSLYLSAMTTFSGGTMLGYGELDCRRMR